MKKPPIFLALLVLFLVMSCASNVTAKKYTDDDFKNFKTFAYLPNTTFNLDEFDSNLDQSIEASLISVLNDKMIEKGFSMDKDNPDMLIVLTTSDAINSNEDTRTQYERASAGSSPNYSSSNSTSNNNKRYSGKNNNELKNKPYKKGTLIVEVFNRTSKELMWVGTAKNFKVHISDQTLMTSMMNEIFKKFPI